MYCCCTKVLNAGRRTRSVTKTFYHSNTTSDIWLTTTPLIYSYWLIFSSLFSILWICPKNEIIHFVLLCYDNLYKPFLRYFHVSSSMKIFTTKKSIKSCLLENQNYYKDSITLNEQLTKKLEEISCYKGIHKPEGVSGVAPNRSTDDLIRTESRWMQVTSNWLLWKYLRGADVQQWMSSGWWDDYKRN